MAHFKTFRRAIGPELYGAYFWYLQTDRERDRVHKEKYSIDNLYSRLAGFTLCDRHLCVCRCISMCTII